MCKIIIYKQDNGSVSLIYPDASCVKLYGIDAVAQKDVPSGKPYKIVDVTEDNFPLDGTFNEDGIPNIDKTFRAAWVVDEAELTDGIGAEYTTFPEEA